MIEASPLYWPEGRTRTAWHSRQTARFDTTFARARDEVLRQVGMLCGTYSYARKEADVIVSTNLALRRDGIPLASQRQPDDPGVAVYFTYKKQRVCFACDRWNKIEDNMQAVAKTIDALRGVARWGTGDMMEAAFKGFTALPPPASTEPWRFVLNCHGCNSFEVAESAYQRQRKIAHPDHGGSSDAFAKVQSAWRDARQEFGR